MIVLALFLCVVVYSSKVSLLRKVVNAGIADLLGDGDSYQVLWDEYISLTALKPECSATWPVLSESQKTLLFGESLRLGWYFERYAPYTTNMTIEEGFDPDFIKDVLSRIASHYSLTIDKEFVDVKGLVTGGYFDNVKEAVCHANFESAIHHYESFLDVEEGDLSAIFNLGLSYFQMERYEESIEMLEKGYQLGYLLPFLGLLCDVLVIAERYEEAAKRLKELIQYEPTDLSLVKQLAMLYYDKLDEPDVGIDLLENAFRSNPTFLEKSLVYFDLGMAYYSKKDYQKCKEMYSEGLKIVQKLFEEEQSEYLTHILELFLNNYGVVSFESQDFEKAYDLYSRSLQVKSTSLTYFNRGFVAWRLGKFQQCVDDFTQVIEVYGIFDFHKEGEGKYNMQAYEGEDLNIFYRRGLCNERIQNFWEAVVDFSNAIDSMDEDNENESDYLIQRARSFLKVNHLRYRMALKDLERIIEKDQNNLDPEIMKKIDILREVIQDDQRSKRIKEDEL